VETTSAEMPAAAQKAAGFVQVTAIDGRGNESPLSQALPLGNPDPPSAPVVAQGGRDDQSVQVLWRRPAPGTCVGYLVERAEGDSWNLVARIDDPWQDSYRVSGLWPGESVILRVSAIPLSGAPVASRPLTLRTVTPPGDNVRLRFAVIMSTDGVVGHLDGALSDAREAGGLGARVDTSPPWTQNRVMSTRLDSPLCVELLGRSPRQAPLTFTIVRPPQHGRLVDEGGRWTYHPNRGFTGQDYFLYRADDGGRWPGNTGWVRITVEEASRR
jgi:hypothetical protein